MLSGVRAQTSCPEAIAQAIWITRQEPELSRALDGFTDAGLIFRRGSPPYASYLFKHALVKDAAHDSLLRRRREELHARIAVVLEADFLLTGSQ